VVTTLLMATGFALLAAWLVCYTVAVRASRASDAAIADRAAPDWDAAEGHRARSQQWAVISIILAAAAVAVFVIYLAAVRS
jgi:hypothetical protein